MAFLPDVTVASFGKPKAIWKPVLQLYEQRLHRATSFEHVILREKGADEAEVVANAAKLLAPLAEGHLVLVFDERGKAYRSAAFAKLLASVRPRKLLAVIGTSYGLSDEFVAAADRIVSLGPMTLPHELARVTVLEQLYRAETILAGHPYHHG